MNPRLRTENLAELLVERGELCHALIDSLEGRKTAIRELAQETRTEAEEMLQIYLEDEDEALSEKRGGAALRARSRQGCR